MDNKIDFPLHLQGLGVDKTPRTYYISICVLLDSDNLIKKEIKKFKEIQKSLLRGLGLVSNSDIYVYPENTLHFSIMYFAHLSSITIDRTEFIREREEHIKKIIEVMENYRDKFKKLSKATKNIEIKYIYTKTPETLALQAFIRDPLKEFFQELACKLSVKPTLPPVKIKSHVEKKNRFVINLVRFFGKLDNKEFDHIASNIFKFNEKCEKSKKFSINLKSLSLVVSDNYLSEGKESEIYSIS